jgi:hypothetical protein
MTAEYEEAKKKGHLLQKTLTFLQTTMEPTSNKVLLLLRKFNFFSNPLKSNISLETVDEL